MGKENGMSTGGKDMGKDLGEEGLWVDESSVEVSRTSTWWGFNGLNKRNFRLLGRDMKHQKSKRCNDRRIMEEAKFHPLKVRRKISKLFHVQ